MKKYKMHTPSKQFLDVPQERLRWSLYRALDDGRYPWSLPRVNQLQSTQKQSSRGVAINVPSPSSKYSVLTHVRAEECILTT